MGVDSGYGIGSLKPGVCTSTSRPGSPFDGQVIYETDTNRVLVWDNSAWVMIADTDSPPGLQLVKSQTIGTAVSSVTVSDVFSSDFDVYKITVTGGSTSTQLAVRMTLGSTSTGYYQANWRFSGYAGVTASDYCLNNAAYWDAGVANTDSIPVNVELFGPYLTDKTHINLSTFRDAGETSGPGIGYLNNTTSYTAFTLTTSTGTMTGGTIRVYGYRNS